jgi:hypothetical protein
MLAPIETPQKVVATIRHGSEGPPQDPYSFTEYSVNKNGIVITLHLGLAEWLQVENEKFYEHNSSSSDTLNLIDEFKILTGIDPFEAEDDYNNPRCSDHPEADVEEVSGHPGESFAVCSVCKKILESYFNEAEII